MPIIQTVIKGKQPVIDTLNVTPTTSPQQITAPQGTDGYSPVNVSAVTSSIDANIVAGNIKKDVTILGVTGSFEGGVTPTGTMNITSNGVYNVTNYANADVQVPTTAPDYYIEKTKDADGVAQNGGSSIINLSSFKGVGTSVFAYAYSSNTSISGAIDFSSLLSLPNSSSCTYMFAGCTGLTSADLSSLQTISGYQAASYMFQNCTGITTVNLSSLKTIGGSSGQQCTLGMFYGCTSLTSVDLSSLQTISARSGASYMFQNCTGLTSISLPLFHTINAYEGCYRMFYGCSGLTSVDLSSMVKINDQYAARQMFSGCTGLTTVDLSSLLSLTGTYVAENMFDGCSNLASVNVSRIFKLSGTASGMFRNCTSLTELRFNGLIYTTTNFNTFFSGLLSGVTGCTVHFPAEWATTMASWSNITNGLGGTNTTVLFDLPNNTKIDMSYITQENRSNVYSSMFVNYSMPNITSIDLSSLTSITGSWAFGSLAQNCTGITSVDLSSLVSVNAGYCLYRAFSGCTGLTNVNLSSLTTVDSNGSVNALNETFARCTGLTSVDLSSLISINGQSSAQSLFFRCTGLTSVDLSSLTTVTGNSVLSSMFGECTSLTSVNFSSLKTVSGNSAFLYMFQSINGINVYFPAAKNLDYNCIVNMFDASVATVHLPSNYNGSTSFGGTVTILYDLPAVVILTDGNSDEYERNPKYDTATALAWRINGSAVTSTSYYTSTTADPVVGDTIYSDSACTTAVSTISSIA